MPTQCLVDGLLHIEGCCHLPLDMPLGARAKLNRPIMRYTNLHFAAAIHQKTLNISQIDIYRSPGHPVRPGIPPTQVSRSLEQPAHPGIPLAHKQPRRTPTIRPNSPTIPFVPKRRFPTFRASPKTKRPSRLHLHRKCRILFTHGYHICRARA